MDHVENRAGIARLFELAERQYGAFSTSQALALGVTQQQLTTLVRRGLAHRRRRGVYVAGGAVDTAERRTMEAVLAAPPSAVASHQSAAFLLGLVPAPTQVHLTVLPGHRVRLDGVVAHRSPLPSSHVAKVGPIPTTTVARTVVDLASVYDFDELAAVADPLLVAKRLRPAVLLRTLDGIVEAPGRHGTALLRDVLDVWTAPIRPGSPAEVRLLRKLDELGLGGYVTQHPVEVEGERFYLDVAWPERRRLLEYSGRAFHGPRRWRRDERRAVLLKSLGWRYREVDAADLVPGHRELWDWLSSSDRRTA